MPLKLIPPGKRRNACYYARGMVGGQEIEESLETTDKEEAEKRKAKLENDILNEQSAPECMMFYEAAERYKEFRRAEKGRLSERDERWIDEIVSRIGHKSLHEVTRDDVVNIAQNIYPHGAPSSKNRAVLRPIAAIMHYAADCKWCPYIRFKAFKEPPPAVRNVDLITETALLKLTKKNEHKHLLMLWLFKQGNRISEVLHVKYEDIDFKALTVVVHDTKNARERLFPLDAGIARILKKRLPSKGYIFPWQSRSGVHKWLRPLCNAQGIAFTPHRARHTVGKRFKDQGADIRTIMDKLGHASYKSSLRYQAPDIETVRKYG